MKRIINMKRINDSINLNEATNTNSKFREDFDNLMDQKLPAKDESKSNDIMNYIKTSMIMLGELETKISNAVEDGIVENNGHFKNMRLQIADLQKSLNNLNVKKGL